MMRLPVKFARNIVDDMTSRHAVRVRRWRTTMTGCAWSTLYVDGRRINWIESPYPRTPISLAIFLHEIGHHAIGFNAYKLRCEEEYHVWQWSLKTMRSFEVDPDQHVLRRVNLSVQYALDKALRRRLKAIPESLKNLPPLAA